ncbi:co-chaperone GroES family protein [bacterium]|jgi:chaperonin GroES|nr:co-chaperone GroES family protein [bacterium]|tara:strand:+ start:843 stop:1271 length:429 start_codon:yes stop_codon:yes gene_type:complete
MTNTDNSFTVPKEVMDKFDNPEQFLDTERKEMDKLPKPTGWRLLVLPFRAKQKTKGGVLLTDKAVEDSQLTTTVAMVLATGPDAYKDKDKFPSGSWCKQGDWVVFGRYAGSRLKIEGGEVRILNDDEILGTIENPEDILSTV